MGLPDFHTIQTGYREVVIDGNNYTHVRGGNQTFYSYSGYGEIIRLRIQAYKSTANLGIADSFWFYIDGALMSVEDIQNFLYFDYVPGVSILNPVFFQQWNYLTIDIMKGLKFNNSLEIKANMVGGGGNVIILTAATYGLY